MGSTWGTRSSRDTSKTKITRLDLDNQSSYVGAAPTRRHITCQKVAKKHAPASKQKTFRVSTAGSPKLQPKFRNYNSSVPKVISLPSAHQEDSKYKQSRN